MTPPRRLQSQTERDIESARARKEREATPVEVDEPLTGRVDLTDDELFEARRDRAAADPAGRIAILETEQKTLTADVAEMKVHMADIRGDQKAANVSLNGIQKTLEQMSQREHIILTSKVEVDTAQKVAEVKVNEAKQVDAIDAKKAKRELRNKLIGAALGGGGVLTILLKLLEHWGVL